MNDAILKKLAARLDRRSFLRGSSIGVAALLGVAAASPLVVFAQAPQETPAQDDTNQVPSLKSELSPER